jgi:hypothetical protein
MERMTRGWAQWMTGLQSLLDLQRDWAMPAPFWHPGRARPAAAPGRARGQREAVPPQEASSAPGAVAGRVTIAAAGGGPVAGPLRARDTGSGVPYHGQHHFQKAGTSMPKLNVDYDCTLDAAEAFNRVRQLLQGGQVLRRFDPGMTCTFDERALSGKLTGSQFGADVAVRRKAAGSVVSVVVDLPFLLAPFQGKVRETLQSELKKYLA